MFSHVQTVTDHDALSIIAKIPGKNVQTRIKYVGNMERFDLKEYINNFKAFKVFLIDTNLAH